MLDASTRVDVLNLLADLREQGLGIVFITHDLALGSYISDSTVILHRGRIVERARRRRCSATRCTRTRGGSSSRCHVWTRSGRALEIATLEALDGKRRASSSRSKRDHFVLATEPV